MNSERLVRMMFRFVASVLIITSTMSSCSILKYPKSKNYEVRVFELDTTFIHKSVREMPDSIFVGITKCADRDRAKEFLFDALISEYNLTTYDSIIWLPRSSLKQVNYSKLESFAHNELSRERMRTELAGFCSTDETSELKEAFKTLDTHRCQDSLGRNRELLVLVNSPFDFVELQTVGRLGSYYNDKYGIQQKGSIDFLEMRESQLSTLFFEEDYLELNGMSGFQSYLMDKFGLELSFSEPEPVKVKVIARKK